jgi:predicted ribosomally synthesized peptide with nif11-like leader
MVSADQAEAFVAKMKSDAAFRARVMAVEDVTERMGLINAEGFACSAGEIEAVAGALADEELDGVDGGSVRESCACLSGGVDWRLD